MKKILMVSTLTISLTLGIQASDFSKDVREKVEVEGGSVISLVEKQRMLIQKMGSELLHKEKRGKLIKTVTLFDKTLKGLIKGDMDLALIGTTDKKILKQLKKVERQWNLLKIDKKKPNLKLYVPLLKNMNKTIKMYAVNSNNKKVMRRAEIFEQKLNKRTKNFRIGDIRTKFKEIVKIDISNF